MTRAALGLGANLGQPRVTLRAAVQAVAADRAVQVLDVSSLWRTQPVGGPQQPDYLNAVVLVDTALPAPALLGVASRLEDVADRRREQRWGPRTLDVDLLDMAGVRCADPALTVPHPRAHQRAFVLAPWAEVDPQWLLDPTGLPARTVLAWRDESLAQPGQRVEVVAERGWWR